MRIGCDDINAIFQISVNKLSYREHTWKPRTLQLMETNELRYLGADNSVRGIISLEDCHCRGPVNYVDPEGKAVPHVLMFSAERSTSVAHGRWWIKREYSFAAKSKQEAVAFKTMVLKLNEKASEASYEKIHRTASYVEHLGAASNSVVDESGDAAGAKTWTSWLTSYIYRFAAKAPETGEIWMLGCLYDPQSPDKRKSMACLANDFHSRLWFTYRRGFKSIVPTTWSTDSGWGCMLRSGQMMLAEGLLRHCVGREWRLVPNRPPPKEYVKVLRFFEDDPNAPFSIHRIAQFGEFYGKKIGEWFGPNTVCQVLKFLSDTGPMDDLVVYMPESHAIVREEVKKLCSYNMIGGSTSSSSSGLVVAGKKREQWKGCIILVPLRLGVEGLNVEYIPKLVQCLSFPQSIGFIGGKPRSSFYFVAHRGNTETFYLDPHTTQDYQTMEKSCDISTYHCDSMKRMSLNDLDPSLAVGFYCAGEAEFNDLCVRLHTSHDQDTYPLMEVTETRVDYSKRVADMKVADSIEEDDWEDGMM